MEKFNLMLNTEFGIYINRRVIAGIYSKEKGYDLRCNFDNFLSKSLTLGMFVPCDLEGNVLEEPNQYIGALELAIGKDYDDAFEYQQAKERVLFEGFEIEEIQEYLLYIKKPNFKNGLDLVFQYGKKSKTFHYSLINYKSIEDLISLNLELTQTAINQIQK